MLHMKGALKFKVESNYNRTNGLNPILAVQPTHFVPPQYGYPFNNTAILIINPTHTPLGGLKV
jgi:hypothetical protein